MNELYNGLHLELTNQCNFDCSFCPKTVMSREKDFMEEKDVKHILDKVNDLGLARDIYFHILGEPLLHPSIYQLINYTNGLGLNPKLFTNGALLNKKNRINLINAEPNEVVISYQTYLSKSFDEKGGKQGFEEYRKQLLNFIKKAEKSEKDIDIVIKIGFLKNRFYYLLFGQPVPDFESDLGILKKDINYWLHSCKEMIDDNDKRYPKTIRKPSKLFKGYWTGTKPIAELTPNTSLEAHSLFSWKKMFEAKYPTRKASCNHLRGESFGILSNGDVVLCCMDYEGKTSIGNIYDMSLNKILDRLDKIREHAIENVLIHPACQSCKGTNTIMGYMLRKLKDLI